MALPQHHLPIWLHQAVLIVGGLYIQFLSIYWVLQVPIRSAYWSHMARVVIGLHPDDCWPYPNETSGNQTPASEDYNCNARNMENHHFGKAEDLDRCMYKYVFIYCEFPTFP